MRAEDLVKEIQDKLLESHKQAVEMDKVLMQEIEKMKVCKTNYETLCEQRLSLEGELKARESENDQLRTQLQSVEEEKEQLVEQVQSLKTLREGSLAKEMTISTDKEQLKCEI